ncbi:MAG TPA: thiamine pyrophosphate-dependent dehydrogenase E1 component subunit alpha [Mycobacteriales bacterium]|nr:thiamine pyrophosphate-dependent dehydrogenase E1 component subunit alpha [Mycobacteriales bacterium]
MGTASEIPTSWPTVHDSLTADATALLRTMRLIRGFEDGVQTLFLKGLVRGSTHLYSGQEAVAVGVCAAMQPQDTMTCTYRGHGAVIAIGSELDRCFAEILGRELGLCHGKGGSMHLTDVARGALGSNAIVGANLPISLGAAYASQVLGTGSVAVAFFGDGASNIGAFHESLNMAAVWKLPVLFVLENNQYGEYSAVAQTTGITVLADRAAAYGIPGVRVDGNDVRTMQAAAEWALDHARRGNGPVLLEANTYRHHGHSRSDQATYRPTGELDEWLARDPISLLRDALISQGRLDSGADDEAAESAAREVSEAMDRALASPEPRLSALTTDVFA